MKKKSFIIYPNDNCFALLVSTENLRSQQTGAWYARNFWGGRYSKITEQVFATSVYKLSKTFQTTYTFIVNKVDITALLIALKAGFISL